MSLTLNIKQRNKVLTRMAELVVSEKTSILDANKKDFESYKGDDLAMADRLKVDDAKIEAMLLSLQQLASQPDPLGVERFEFTHENGIHISNKTAPFGTVCIIYESRPDVTIEAAGIAFKSGNKILLKGGKESLHSNLALVNLWHKALEENNCTKNWITYLEFNREQTQEFLQNPTQKIDLIVPRGGEKLIAFVKKYATCPVIISGRGNNFAYVETEADLEMAIAIIINAKTTKISACNALDKVLIAADIPRKHEFLNRLIHELKKNNVAILTDTFLSDIEGITVLQNETVWFEEFLDYKIVIGQVATIEEAITKITENSEKAALFMEAVDSAAVYQNTSTRFTDGFQFGLGGELAISTDKLHQRGPIGLQHLVTNKWYITGNGQIR